MDARQVAAITHRRRREQAEKDLAIERNRLSLAVDERLEEQPLVQGFIGRDLGAYCGRCVRHSGYQPPVPFSFDPGTACATCGGAL
jgi:hypothetical protein